MTIDVTIDHSHDLPYQLKTSTGLHSAGRTLSEALSMLARMQKRREDRGEV